MDPLYIFSAGVFAGVILGVLVIGLLRGSDDLTEDEARMAWLEITRHWVMYSVKLDQWAVTTDGGPIIAHGKTMRDVIDEAMGQSEAA